MLQNYSFSSYLFNLLSLVYTIRATVGSFQKHLSIVWQALLLLTTIFASLDILFIYLSLFLVKIPKVFVWYTKIETICIRLPLLVTVLVLYILSGKSNITQTDISMFESLLFVILTIICELINLRRPKQNSKKEQTLLLFAIISAFIPLFIAAAIFNWLEKMNFEEAWNFVNVTALTVGYGNILITTIAGKIFLITFGNVMLAFAGILLIALRNAIPVTKIATVYFTSSLLIYWIFGAIIFMILEKDWGFLNSMYFVWVTFSSVGYGDFYPTNPWSWEFWLIYVYIAIGFVSYFLGIISEQYSSIFIQNS